jgi:hypothetical protein
MNIVAAIQTACKNNGTPYATWDEILTLLAAWGELQDDKIKTALNDLKAVGAITFPDRGRNARTRYEVIDSNREPATVAPTVPEGTPVAVPEGTPMAPRPLQETVLPFLPDARSLDAGEGYGKDNYFSRVAMNMTPCFGGWTPKAKTCDGCSLRHECRNAAIAELHAMAARWSPTTIEAPPAIVEPVKVAYPTVRAPFDVICAGCSNNIATGSDMVYDPAGKPSGCYHESCC